MRWIARIILIFLLLVAGGYFWATRYRELPPVAVIDRPEPSAEVVEQGEMLATFGGCESCHGSDLSGGIALPTPFGTIYSTNITPDPDTGIGRWSAEAFRRAMRQGIDREGGYLYPAFPYDNFTKASDADLDAIYAYLMAQQPVAKPETPNGLAFPFNIRLAMSGWNLLFLDAGPFRPDPARDEVWNRGAYLAEGLGHCGACHSPRNRFGARMSGYGGGTAEGWFSPALDDAMHAPVKWTTDALINYFYDGWDKMHGIAAGPMKEVVEHLAVLSEEDMEALATYIRSLRGNAVTDDAAAISFSERAAIGSAANEVSDYEPGLALFLDRCANCHRAGSETVPLGLATALWAPVPENFLKVVVQGITPSENAYWVRPMPGFANLSDQELIDLAKFARSRFSTERPWDDLGSVVSAARSSLLHRTVPDR